MTDPRGPRRRDVLGAGLGAGAFALLPQSGAAGVAPPPSISFIVDPADPVAASGPVQWALGELRGALTATGAPVLVFEQVEQAPVAGLCVAVGSSQGALAASASAQMHVSIGEGPERFSLFRARISSRDVRVACASDVRGLVYALLHLAERIRAGQSPAAALALNAPFAASPTNPVRSVMRQFTSEALDKSWFEDREMWPHYLRMLASNRFNRLHLAFGLGYDVLRGVADSYLLFLYPFLLDVPGYPVRVTNLTGEQRAANLAALQFISEQTVARGLEFQLGIWMHGYELIDSPNARYIVEGLTQETHAAYCRDALTALLRACPAISSVALRIHGESGVAEGSYDFWQTVFDGVARCGRTVEIDLHAKGIDQTMIDRALDTGLPVNLSPKYSAEHMGMPYHQAAIRELEQPAPGQTGRGLMTLSEGSRSFTRYGYADLLREDRRYTVRHRMFAGTQKLLLSGDPGAIAAYSRSFSFCGSTGADLMEPLTCRGRRGTGIAGESRTGYVTPALEPHWDWQKFEAWYVLWGRLTYDPSADADALGQTFRSWAFSEPGFTSALRRASRILPIITTAHMPSAACDAYWPEIYWNQPMSGVPTPNPYGDTPSPKTFQHVSPLDPQMFSSADEHAGELLDGNRSAKYSPIEVAQWLEDLSEGIRKDIALIDGIHSVSARRALIDIDIQAGLGRFFASKFRAGVLYAIHERTNDRGALDHALSLYRRARTEWAGLAAEASDYAPDLAASDKISARGHWRDRLAGIDDDIAKLSARAALARASAEPNVAKAVGAALARPRWRTPSCAHTPPAAFHPGQELALSVRVVAGRSVTAVRCYYRHVNQAEHYQEAPIARRGREHHVVIPASYTNSAYPLQYYFVASHAAAAPDLCPGLGEDLLGTPYFVVRRARES